MYKRHTQFILLYIVSACLTCSVFAEPTTYISSVFTTSLYHVSPSLSILSYITPQEMITESENISLIMAEVFNNGPGTAFDVTCFLDQKHPPDQYGNKAIIGSIPPGESKQVLFQIDNKLYSNDNPFSIAVTERYGSIPDIIEVSPDISHTANINSVISIVPNPYYLELPKRNGKTNTNVKALLIGNRLYHSPSLPMKEYAVRDVRSFRDFLISASICNNNDILESFNIDYEEMEYLSNADSLSAHLGAFSDIHELIIYFNGYGFISGEYNEMYLAPVDCPFNSKEIPDYGFLLSNLYSTLAQSGIKNILLVLDAAFYNSAGETVSCDFSSFSSEIPDGVLIAADSRTGDSYPHVESMHSLLTYSLLKGFSDELSAGTSKITCSDISHILLSAPYSVPSLESIRFRGGSTEPVIIGRPDTIVLDME